jgi:hypothetical protein
MTPLLLSVFDVSNGERPQPRAVLDQHLGDMRAYEAIRSVRTLLPPGCLMRPQCQRLILGARP